MRLFESFIKLLHSGRLFSLHLSLLELLNELSQRCQFLSIH